MFDWVRALLDPTDIVQSPSSAKKQITPPPKFDMPPIEAPIQLSAAATRLRRGRSASPSKRAASPRKPRTTRATKEANVAATNAANASLQSSLEADAGSANGTVEQSVEVDEEETKSEVVEKPRTTTRSKKAAAPVEKEEEEEEEKKVKVDVEESVDKGKDAQTKQTTFSVEMPVKFLPDAPSAEDTEQMIAKAREMVQEAVDSKATEEVPAESSSRGAQKRKTDDLSKDSEDEETKAASTQRVKRAKVLEEKLKRERVRNRALVGVTAAFALA